jgi:hypothetical protein
MRYTTIFVDQKTRVRVTHVGVRGIWVKGVGVVSIINMSEKDSL